MPFTDKERMAWHEAKRKREERPQISSRPPPLTECVHCGSPFGFGEGYISHEVSLCDACDGD